MDDVTFGHSGPYGDAWLAALRYRGGVWCLWMPCCLCIELNFRFCQQFCCVSLMLVIAGWWPLRLFLSTSLRCPSSVLMNTFWMSMVNASASLMLIVKGYVHVVVTWLCTSLACSSDVSFSGRGNFVYTHFFIVSRCGYCSTDRFCFLT